MKGNMLELEQFGLEIENIAEELNELRDSF
jgi:hypothetical protein